MGSETISAVMSALAIILGMIGAMFSVKHTASSIEKTSDGDAKEAKEAAQKVQEGNKDIISLMLNNMSELREYYVINKRQANRVFNATLTACVMGGIIFIIGSIVAFWGGQKVSFYTTISGCVVELISGFIKERLISSIFITRDWVQQKSISQRCSWLIKCQNKKKIVCIGISLK